MQPSVHRAPLRAILALAVLAAALTAAFAVHPPSSGAAADAATSQVKKPKKPKRKAVSVMSRNVYLGADLTDAIEAQTLPELFFATQQIWDDVAENDFPSRAELLASEIEQKKPDLIGLQEVALWRYDPPANGQNNGGIGDGPATPAEEVRYDYLQELLDALDGKYRVVRSQQQFDFEAPLLSGSNREGGDGRLTMRDVILARNGAGVRTSNPRSGSFRTSYTPSVGGQEVRVLRGWESTIANVRGAKFKFVNTHLEAFDNDAKLAQARELVARKTDDYSAGPANPQASRLPIVLVGDLNSDDEIVERLGDSEGHRNDEKPYAAIRNVGFLERSPDKGGLANDDLSCCMNGSVIDAEPGSERAELTHVVDHIMVNDRRIKLTASAVTGTNPRTESGLAASDHSGVFSKLSFPPKR